MSGRALTFFGVTGALALLALSFPPAVFVAGLFLIVPGLILWAASPVFMYSVLGYVSWHATEGMRPPARFAIVLAAVAVVAVGPVWYFNLPINQLRAEMTADDLLNGPIPPLNDKTLAILTPSRGRYGGQPRRDTDCDSICQRLLYNGAVRRVIRGAFAAGVPVSEPAVVRAYRIEQRESCPSATLPDDTDSWPGDPQDYADRERDRIGARIAAGQCLISESATLAEADYLLRDYSVRQPPPEPASGIADTVQARRLEFGASVIGGPPRIIHRRTQVESRPVAMPFMIVNDIHGNSMAAGFLRLKAVDNRYTFQSETRALFGDGVKFPERNASPGAEVAVLLRALRDPALAANDPRLALGDQVLKRIGAKGPSSPQDAEAVRLLIEDRRVTSFFYLADAVWRLGPAAAPLAGPLLERLLAAPLPAGRDTVQTTSRAIANLPPGALAPVMSELDKLAAIEGRRGLASLAVSRLGDAGAPGVSRLVALLETRRGHRSLPPHADERGVVIGALLGLCRMGTDAASAIDPLVAFLREELDLRGTLTSRGDLAVLALARMGAADRVLQLAEQHKGFQQQVQFKLRQAERPLHRNQCSY